MIEQVKTLLGIEDSVQDAVLLLIVSNITSHLQILLGKTEVPKSLEFVIVELAVRRYQRIGSEGMKAESVEGHNITFYDLADDFVPYMRLIEKFAEKEEEKGKKGKVTFI